MNKLIKKKMNKKGFTLIELIVVIAILGILAAIAIPRFSGFTDRAKIAADEQLAALTSNSALVLLAAGDISDGDFTVTYTQATGVFALTDANYTGSIASFDAAMKAMIESPKLQLKATLSITFANGTAGAPSWT